MKGTVTVPAVRPVNKCGNGQCPGEMKLISVSVEERKRLRIGGSWMAQCGSCGWREVVKPEVWKRFWKELKEQKDRRSGQGRSKSRNVGQQRRFQF